MFRIFCFLFLAWLICVSQRDRLPPASEILTCLAADPVQGTTFREPFEVRREGTVYHIKPVASYELCGLVVSYHNSDSFWDIAHRMWNDKLNFRDLGVVWGHNALSGVYREVKFSSRDFTLFFHPRNDLVWSKFRLDQVSNNHILAGDAEVMKTLRAIGRGDQILIRGVLCEYSHGGGSRGTSLSRMDQGNGACETVFVDSAVVLREANRGWRMLAQICGWLWKLAGLMLLWDAWKWWRRKPEEEWESGEPRRAVPLPPPPPPVLVPVPVPVPPVAVREREREYAGVR